MQSIKTTFSYTYSMFFLALSCFFYSFQAYSLNCRDTRILAQNILKLHFDIHEFSPDLASKTIKEFIKILDPGKVFFIESDVKEFLNQTTEFQTQLQQANCSIIDGIYTRYNTRFEEQNRVIQNWIKIKPNFKLDDFLDFDRKKQNYAKDSNELKERWRKRIKLQYMQLLDDIGKNKKTDKEIQERLKKRYDLMKKRQEETKMDDVYGMFLDAFSLSLDPHSDYFAPAELEEFRVQTRLSLEGIGALLRSEDGFTSIVSLVPGGAAAKSGLLQTGDKIIAVAEGIDPPVDVVDMDLKDVVALIRGRLGTKMKLTIRRDSKELIVPLTREKIQLDDKAAKSFAYQVIQNKEKHIIGVINLPSFYMDFEGKQNNVAQFRSSSKDVETQIEVLKKQNVDAIILDLRSNGGGSLDESINITGLFSGKAPIVQTKGQENSPSVSPYQGEAAYKGPLLVLIDRQSASASEIFAGAIKDFQRGFVIGDEHTFGKGTVQNLVDIDKALGAVKVTIQKFYRPLGGSTQLKGVDSDIIIPSLSNEYEIGEKFYDYALPWSQIEPLKNIPHFNLVTPYRDALAKESQKRVDGSKKFKEIKEAIEKYNKNKPEQFKISLKEKTKEEKAKEAKDRKDFEEKEKKRPKDSFGNSIIGIEDDPQLAESLYIATDYIRLLNKKSLSTMTEFPSSISMIANQDKAKSLKP